MAEPRFRIGVKRIRKGQEHPELRKVQGYLTRFGYLRTTVTPGRLDPATSQALSLFQRCFGLKQVGELDAATVRAMERPRCGVPDLAVIRAAAGGGTHAAYVITGCKYNKLDFTYRFLNDSSDIAGAAERPAVRRAFNTWASVLCGVTFQETTSTNADFTIGWFSGDHGDGVPFDGSGNGSSNVLAHAFFPPPCGGQHAGATHFDEYETWTVNDSILDITTMPVEIDVLGKGIDVETVALHEIGHLLGLDHSTIGDAVMFPMIEGVRRTLHQDDINGIRSLYPAMYRRGDSGAQAGFVAEIDAVRHRTTQTLTAVRTQAGKLRLIAWRVNANGSVIRTGDSGDQAGAASSISIARSPTGNRYVTACRTSSGALRLISWDVNDSGTSITRRGDSGSQAGTASLIRVTALDNGLWVTACRTSDGRLRVISWQRNADGSFNRLGDSGGQAGAVSEIAMTAIASDRVATAVRTGSGDLRVITWSADPTGLVKRLGDSGNQAGASRMIKVVTDEHGNLVTAVKTSAGNLRLISWKVLASGGLTRLADSGNLASVTKAHDLGRVAHGGLATAVQTSSGQLKVILWETHADGTIARSGDSDGLAGSADLPTLVEPLGGAASLVTCVRTTTGNLKLITWGCS